MDVNKNYNSGRACEYKVARRLKAEGAQIAQRSAGSHSPVDVWAVSKDGRSRLIQVKKDTASDRVDKLKELYVLPPTTKELWHWRDGDFEITVL